MIYTAKAIYTMDKEMKKATAIAIEGKKIVGIGSHAELQKQFPDVEVSDEYKNDIILPGFVESHTHPTNAVMIYGTFKMITPYSWDLGDVKYDACPSREEFFKYLKKYADEMDPGETLFIYGHLDAFYGDVTRYDIDKVVSDCPVCILHGSLHKASVNSKAIEEWGFTPELGVGKHEGLVELGENGELLGVFEEGGVLPVYGEIMRRSSIPEKLAVGAKRLVYTMHNNGVTTLADMSFGLSDFESEYELYLAFFNKADVKVRTRLTPLIMTAVEKNGEDRDKAFEFVSNWVKQYCDENAKVSVMKAAKFFGDGSLIGHTARMTEPYIGTEYNGEFVADPGTLKDDMLPYWKDGYAIYTHSQGDATQDLLLDTLEQLQKEHPRSSFIYRLEHFGVSREDQFERLGNLKPQISTLAYNFPLSWIDALAKIGKYHEATIERMFAMRSVIDAGISLSIHSDTPVSPIQPLLGAQGGVLRRGPSGQVYGEQERITMDEALRSITIEGAKQLNIDSYTGSLEVGKRADMVVLGNDPYEVGPVIMHEIPIITTFFEGRK